MSVRSYCGPPNPCINILGSLRDTTVDGGLYMYETNNNNIIKGHRTSFFGNLFSTGTLRRSSYYSSSVPDPLTDRSMLISSILSKEEKRAVLEYVGDESSLLAVGVCELLEESNGSWHNPRRGVVCLIKENANKIYSISLLKPSTTKVIWCERISRTFQTTKDHDHLVTFEIGSKDTNNISIYGLNFYDAEEASRFHLSVMEQYESYCARKPQRVAPQRPAEHSTKPIVLTEDSLSAVTIGSSEELALPVKTKKNSLFGGLFSRKKNKKDKKDKKKESKNRLTPEDISNPTDFEHLCGADYTTEEREAVQILKEQIKFDENDPGQRELLRKFATEHHAAIRASIRAKPNESFQRGTFGLEGARSSIMLHKPTKGYTPREIKRTSDNKKNESIQEEREPTSSADEDKNSPEEPEKPFDPIHPDWEKCSPAAVPSFSPQPPSHSTHSTGFNTHRYSNNNNEYDYNEKRYNISSKPSPNLSPAPPAPARTASRSQFVRQNTPPYPGILADRDPSRPRLPGNDEPIPSRLAYHFTKRVSSSPPSSPPPPPISSPSRPPPPISSKASGSVFPPPVPPPPIVKSASPDTFSPPSEASPPPPLLPPTSHMIHAAASSVPKAPPPPPLESSPPTPPPLPPTLLAPAAATSPVRNAPPPPPPLGGLNLAPKISSTTTSPSLSPGPPVSPDRRSFLDEIQNVDKSKLLRSPNTPSLPQKQSNEVDGSIMSSIQRMMDSIRPQLGDSDSDSDDSTSTDSDWSE